VIASLGSPWLGLANRHYAVYPANLCPLLFCGELAEFSGDFGEAI
jgi:hypothetical protein